MSHIYRQTKFQVLNQNFLFKQHIQSQLKLRFFFHLTLYFRVSNHDEQYWNNAVKKQQ